MRLRRMLAGLGVAALASLGITAAVTAPAYASTNIAGSVACVSGNPVEGVWIDADSGTDNWARMNVPGGTSSTVSWTYTLTSGTGYHFHVGCGGSPNNWAVATYSGHRTGNSNSAICYDIAYEAPYGTCS